MDFSELVQKRHSVRDFLDKSVDRALLLSILDTGRLAPSACNNQPWLFVVIEDKADRKRMEKVYDRPWFLNAPVILAVCCDHKRSWKRKDGKDFGEVDIAIVMDHITLAATEKGLGTCWIGAFDCVEAGKILKLPPYIEPIVLTPIGYSVMSAPVKTRKSLSEILHWGYYGGESVQS